MRFADDASDTATVLEVRAHDRPGLLYRVARAIADCGLDVRTARVGTLGAEAVDAFYLVDAAGGTVTDDRGPPGRTRGRARRRLVTGGG